MLNKHHWVSYPSIMNVETNGDGDIPVHNVDLDGATDRSISYTVITSIADLTGKDPENLEPLWDSVDTDALDSFVAHECDFSTPYRLAFEYEGYTVEVISGQRLQFTPNTEAFSSPTV